MKKVSVIVGLIFLILSSSFAFSYPLPPKEISFQTDTGVAGGSTNLESLEKAAKEAAKTRAKNNAREICKAENKQVSYPNRPDTTYLCPGPNIMDLDGNYIQVKCTATIPYSCN